MSAQQVKRITKTQIKISTSLFLVLVLMLPPVVNIFIANTSAAALTNAKVMINNSQAGASSVTYSFRFTTPATTSIGRLKVEFCQESTSTGTCTLPTSMVTTGAEIATDNIAGTGRSNTFTGNGTLDTNITTPAAQSTQAVAIDYTGITNPSTINTTSYARITTYQSDDTTELDTAVVAFAVLNTGSVAVTATVDPNFTFTVAGVTSGGNFNGGTGNVNVTTTANTIPFGTLASGTPKIAAHDVTITTNAGSGYTVTASHSGTAAAAPLNSGSNNIDTFTGTNGTPTTWSAPGGSTANTNTGFFGYSSEDSTLCTGTAARFTTGGAKWAGSSITGEEVICSTTGVSSQTTRLGWQAEVNAIQPAGAYTGTVILVATPTY
jgi:hypothetical protein